MPIVVVRPSQIVGDSKTFTIRYPDDYSIKELAGTSVAYTVTVKGLKRRVVPALDDEFAKDNDINPAKETHMHALSIAFEDNDHIVQKWTTFEKGKATGVVTLRLTRMG